jgi:hypothetical protein
VNTPAQARSDLLQHMKKVPDSVLAGYYMDVARYKTLMAKANSAIKNSRSSVPTLERLARALSSL